MVTCHTWRQFTGSSLIRIDSIFDRVIFISNRWYLNILIFFRKINMWTQTKLCAWNPSMFHKMAQLRSDIHSDLTEYAIKLLHQNKVYTDVDFIQGDPRKLANITNLGIYCRPDCPLPYASVMKLLFSFRICQNYWDSSGGCQSICPTDHQRTKHTAQVVKNGSNHSLRYRQVRTNGSFIQSARFY